MICSIFHAWASVYDAPSDPLADPLANLDDSIRAVCSGAPAPDGCPILRGVHWVMACDSRPPLHSSDVPRYDWPTVAIREALGVDESGCSWSSITDGIACVETKGLLSTGVVELLFMAASPEVLHCPSSAPVVPLEPHGTMPLVWCTGLLA